MKIWFLFYNKEKIIMWWYLLVIIRFIGVERRLWDSCYID